MFEICKKRTTNCIILWIVLFLLVLTTYLVTLYLIPWLVINDMTLVTILQTIITKLITVSINAAITIMLA